MPYSAEVVPLVFELLHFDDLGKTLNARDERVRDGLTHCPRERHELPGIELLVAEEDDLVLEKSAAYCGDDLIRQLSEVNSQELCTERTGDASHFHLERSGVRAAIHEQVLSGDEPGLRAAEEGARVAELLDGAEAAGGIRLRARSSQLGGGLAKLLRIELEVGTQPVGLKRSGQEVVDCDVMAH